MFVKAGPNSINLDDARTIYAKPFHDGIRTQPGIEVVWANGTMDAFPGRIEDIEAMSGTFITAAAGCKVIEAFEQDGKVTYLNALPVVAWRITGGGSDNVIPITPDGEPKGETWATTLPDGSCFEPASGATVTVDEWKKRAASRLTQKAAAE